MGLMTQVQTGVRVGGTEVGNCGTAWTVAVSQVEVSRTGKTEVHTGVGVAGTEVGGNGTARTSV